MPLPTLGVVIVAFNSSDVILDCLESLLASRGVRLRIVVVDNASTDGIPACLTDWASGRTPYIAPPDIPFALHPKPKPLSLAEAETADADLMLLRAPVNGGFAAGVNLGLAHLAQQADLERFWVLNPDCVVTPGAALAFATHPAPDGGFALMGGRVTYLDPPDRIQIDGGTLNRRTGVTGNLGLGLPIATTPPPAPEAMDFITGASMVVSRAFYEAVGPMAENYFLYYEEVDWAMQRGALPLLICPEARVYHRAGTAIGSPTLERIASPFSQYFKHRGRMRFMRRFHPQALPWAWAYGLAKAAQYALKGHGTAAKALLAGCRDAPPPAGVRDRLSPEAARLAFAPAPGKG